MGLLANVVRLNVRASQWFDRMFPSGLRVDGNSDYCKHLIWRYAHAGQHVYDVGGGKQPFFDLAKKQELSLRVTGIDISASELGRAPPGAYDSTMAADICSFRGNQDADLVVCQALLEHVPDTQAALAAIASILKPGGVCVLFVPCRNAPFARLNLWLPENWKRFILFTLFPSARHAQGFRSYYDRCTPSRFGQMAEGVGLSTVDLKRYYMSSYFSFFLPLYMLWRLWTVLTIAIGADDWCETFSMVLRREPASAASTFG
ncbi:MAG: methyltransferase domain-containing protein [Rubrivivax sp.]|nr:methyltransferase domain-containing protein [Rubrivivax sp.]